MYNVQCKPLLSFTPPAFSLGAKMEAKSFGKIAIAFFLMIIIKLIWALRHQYFQIVYKL